MSIFSGPVQKKKVYPLIETGEYVVTLHDLTFKSGPPYGDGLLWEWLVALPSDPTGYICRDDGQEKTIHEYTAPDVILRSKPHEWIASLTGQVLEENDTPPDAEDLIGKRMTVYLTHLAPTQGPNTGILRERFVAGSSKRWAGAHATVARNAPAKVVDPEAERRMDVVEKLERLIGKAVKLETPNCRKYVSLDLERGDLDQLRQLVVTIQEEVTDALDA